MNSVRSGAVTGYVMAGGESRRMGGANKALVEHAGQPLYHYAVANLRSCCDEITINTHRDQSTFQAAGFRVIGDGEFQGCGPVAGLHAALADAKTLFVAVAACDQLELPTHVYRTLVCEATADRGAYAYSDQNVVPTCAVLPTTLEAAAREALTCGHRSLMGFMQVYARPFEFNGVDFANLNSVEQVSRT